MIHRILWNGDQFIELRHGAVCLEVDDDQLAALLSGDVRPDDLRLVQGVEVSIAVMSYSAIQGDGAPRPRLVFSAIHPRDAQVD